MVYGKIRNQACEQRDQYESAMFYSYVSIDPAYLHQEHEE